MFSNCHHFLLGRRSRSAKRVFPTALDKIPDIALMQRFYVKFNLFEGYIKLGIMRIERNCKVWIMITLPFQHHDTTYIQLFGIRNINTTYFLYT